MAQLAPPTGLTVSATPVRQGKHVECEKKWLQRFDFLKSHGYLLRPRYRPGWVAPWGGDQSPADWEDGIIPVHDHLLDAIRISDGQQVVLKYVPKTSPEIEIGKYLSSVALQHDPRSHTIPILEVLEDEITVDHVILVTPLLRQISEPDPVSVRECVDFVEQTLEGLAFLHEHKVAHRDCASRNIMMDGRALFPQGWHPQARYLYPDGTFLAEAQFPSRTASGGVRYYFIDFGISTHNQDMTVGAFGNERAPELSLDVPYDPYKLDVYILGMTYRHFFIEKKSGMEFLLPFIEYMTPQKPQDRPTAAEVVAKFNTMKAEMSQSLLSQRLRSLEPESVVSRVLNDTRYRMRDFWWRYTSKPVVLTPFV